MDWRNAPLAVLVALSLYASGSDAETLRIATGGRVSNLGNPYASMMTRGMHPSSVMFDALTKLDDNGKVAPVLATSWEAVTPTRWMFELRQGITFANGEPFDAHAAAAVFDFLTLPESRSLFMGGEARNIEQAHAVDDFTLDIRTKKPMPFCRNA